MSADPWQRFRRTGTVRAERLTEPLDWRADGGDRLEGAPGDWKVTDGTRVWTVADEQFRRSYVRDGDVYRRRGEVRARPGRPGETVDTLEGLVRVAPGDWVVQGEGGERWPVPSARFAEAYSQVAD